MNTPNTNESPNYDNLSLKELKAIAQERQIVPEGNKTKKDTWISALTENDRALSTPSAKSNTIESFAAADIIESPVEKLSSKFKDSANKSEPIESSIVRATPEDLTFEPVIEAEIIEPTESSIIKATPEDLTNKSATESGIVKAAPKDLTNESQPEAEIIKPVESGIVKAAFEDLTNEPQPEAPSSELETAFLSPGKSASSLQPVDESSKSQTVEPSIEPEAPSSKLETAFLSSGKSASSLQPVNESSKSQTVEPSSLQLTDEPQSQAPSNKSETAQPAPEQLADQFQPKAKPSESKINFAKFKNDKLASSQSAFNSKASREAQDYILENIVTALDQRRIDVDRLQINFDGQNIFKMNKGDIAHSTVSDRQTELIKQALNDPASFKGSIKITNGSQVLLHVKDGQVLRDGLNLTKANTKVEISSAPEDLYDKYAENISSKGLKATKDIAVNALSAGVEKEQVKEVIQSSDAAYANLQTNSGKKSADRALDKIIASADAEVKLKRQNRRQSLSPQPALSRR